MLKESGEGRGLHPWDSDPLVSNSRMSCCVEGQHHLGDVEVCLLEICSEGQGIGTSLKVLLRDSLLG